MSKHQKLKAIEIRLYPNQSHRELLDQYFGVSRFVYNACLQHKQDIYSYNQSIKDDSKYEDLKLKSSISELNKYVINLKKYVCPWLSSVNSKVQQQAIINLDKAYNSFFKKQNDFPKFKSKSNNQSCRFPIDAIAKSSFENDKLSLVKGLMNISFKCSKRDEEILRLFRSNIKSITLTKNCVGEYKASVLIEIPIEEIVRCGNGQVGIDLGVKTFATLSNGLKIEQQNWIRDNQKRLSKLQCRMSKKKKGSKNRNKARIQLSKLHNKITNQKKHFLHDTVNRLIDENQVICLETLKVKNMMSNHKLARAIQEKNFSMFINLLEQKATSRGCQIVKIDQWFASSKTCSCCKHKNDNLQLKDREWTCDNCHTMHDRDINAAINILNEGLKLLNMIGTNKPDSETHLVSLKDCGDETLVLSVKQ